MRTVSFPVIVISGLVLATGAAWAQSAIAARAGMIHYSEGKVAIDGERLTNSPGLNQEFKFVNEGETLSTTRGRAEVLLNPGTFLRVAENSSVQLVSSELEDTKVRLVSGSALIEVAEVGKFTSVVIEVGTSSIRMQKQGLYQFTADEPTRLRVYEGEALVADSLNASAEQSVKVRKGRELALNTPADQLASVEPAKFDRDDNDALYNWSSRRARVLGQVNQSSALLASNGYMSNNGLSSWAYNSMYGMYTYLPGSGYGYSPFGLRYYSPITVVYLYAPRMSATSGLSAQSGAANNGLDASNNVNRSGSGSAATSVGTMSAPAAAAPAAASPNAGGARRR